MNAHEKSGVEKTILRFEERLALTQRALRSFGDDVRAAVDALAPEKKTTLVATVDANGPGANEPTHALAVVLRVYGYTATVSADGVRAVSATASLPSLAEELAAVDGVSPADESRGIAARLHARTGGAALDGAAFLARAIDAVEAAVRERSDAYNPGLSG